MMLLPGWNAASQDEAGQAAGVSPEVSKSLPALVIPKTTSPTEQQIANAEDRPEVVSKIAPYDLGSIHGPRALLENMPPQAPPHYVIMPQASQAPYQEAGISYSESQPTTSGSEQQSISAVQNQINLLEGKLDNSLTHVVRRLEEVANFAQQTQAASSAATAATAAAADGQPPSLGASSVASASYGSLKSELKDLKKQFEALQQAIDGEVLEAFRRLRQQTTDLGEKVENLSSEKTKGGSIRSASGVPGSATPTSAGLGSPGTTTFSVPGQSVEYIAPTSTLEAKVSELAATVSELQGKSASWSPDKRVENTDANDGVKLSILTMAQRLDAVDAQLEELATGDKHSPEVGHPRTRSQEHLFQAVDERVAQMGKDLLRLVEERCATVDLQAQTLTVEQDNKFRSLQEKVGEMNSRLSKVDVRLDPSDYFQSLEERVGNLGSTIRELRGELYDELFKGLRDELVAEIGTEIRSELKTVEGKEAWLMAALNARDRSLQSASSEAHDAIVAAIQSATTSSRNSGNQAGASPATSAFSPLAKMDRSSRSMDESFEAWDTMRREPISPQTGNRLTPPAPPPPGPPEAPSARSSTKSVGSRADSAPRRGRQQAGEPLPTEPNMEDLVVQVSPYRPQARALRSSASRQGGSTASFAGAPQSGAPASSANGSSVSSTVGRRMKDDAMQSAGAEATLSKSASVDGDVRLDTRGNTPPPQKPGSTKGRSFSGGPSSRPGVPHTPPHQSRSTINVPVRQAQMPSTPPTHERQTIGSVARSSRSPADSRKSTAAEGPKKRFPGRVLTQIEEKVNDEMSPNSAHS